MKLCIFAQAVDFLKDFGGRTWARTKDPLIKSYYFGVFGVFRAVQISSNSTINTWHNYLYYNDIKI